MYEFLKNFFKTSDSGQQDVSQKDTNKTFEVGLRKRTQELEAEVASLKEVSRSKDEFIRLTSHEIRTPLDAIRGNIYMVLQGETGEISEKTKEYLDDALAGADRLLRLVSDMLDIARIETGHMKFSLEDINLAALLKTFEGEYAPFAKGARLSLAVEVDPNFPSVYSDNVKVLQILVNLVGNALKFTPPGGSITIRAATSEDTVAISVTDTGIGIAVEDIGKLFTRFPEIDKSSFGVQKGTGLGLFLSKQLADKLGGTIKAESAGLGKGSTFTFWLPISGSKRADTLKRFHQIVLESS